MFVSRTFYSVYFFQNFCNKKECYPYKSIKKIDNSKYLYITQKESQNWFKVIQNKNIT